MKPEASTTADAVPGRIDSPQEAGREEPAAEIPDRAVRVLLVEDTPMNQRLAQSFLRKAGCETHLAENGKIALEKIQEESYDIVLMDCHMPVMDGFEATREIRRVRSEQLVAEGISDRLPIIALTASARVEDRDRCLESGMDDFLTKPYKAADLRRVIDRWVRSAETTRETSGAEE